MNPLETAGEEPASSEVGEPAPLEPEIPDTTAEAVNVVADTLLATIRDVGLAFVAHLPLIIAGILVLFFTWAVVAVFRRFSHRLLARTELRGSLRDLIERLAIITLWTMGLMLAAMVVFPGLTPTRALGALGLASVAVGFAFKDIFENFFAGILILWRFPFERGDFIECENIVGRVEDVTIRMTQLRRPSGELLVLPNSILFKSPVEVLTSDETRRIEIITGVAYGEDVAHSVDVIKTAVEGCETVDRRHDVEIFPQAFGSSSIDIEVAWWCESTPLGVRRSRGEVVTAIKSALDSAGIEIPFPYRTLTFKEPLALESLTDQTKRQEPETTE